MISINQPQFPSFEEKNKDEKWIKKFVKACWDDFNSINTRSFYAGRNRYSVIKKHMMGEQDNEPYLKLLDVDLANVDKEWLRSSKKILPIIPKIARVAKSKLIKGEIGVECKAIDPTSIKEDSTFYAENATRLLLKQAFIEQGMDPKMVTDTEGDFQSLEDLGLYMEYVYKNRWSIEAEEALSLIRNNSNYDNLREEAINQLHDFGFIGYSDYFDANGAVKIELVDVRDVIVGRSKWADFHDAPYKGVVLDLSISEVLEDDENEELKGQTEKIKEMLTTSSFYHGEVNRVDPNNYENERVKVLKIQFFAPSYYLEETGEDKDGNKIVNIRTINHKRNKKNTYKEIVRKCVYEGKWIIGTDIYYGCQLQTNMKVKKIDDNRSDVVMNYHFMAPNLHNMETKGMGELYIPIDDQIQIIWKKYQDVIIRAKKSGIAIEISSLENIPIGKAGKAFTPGESIDYYNKTGNLIYREVSVDGKSSQRRPIEQLQNGLGSEASSYFNEIQNNILLLQQLSGMNDVTDGSTPDSRTSQALAGFANEATNNSIDFMRRAEMNIIRDLNYSLLLRVQRSAKEGRLNGQISALGKGSIEFFKFNPELSARELGIIIKPAATEKEKQDLEVSINIALQQNQINIADKYAIISIYNAKHAQALLQSRVKKNLEEAQNRSTQNQEMNAKLQQESLAQAAQIKAQEIDMESRAKIAVAQEQKNNELEILDRKYAYELQLKEMEVYGRIEQKNKENKGKAYASDTQSMIADKKIQSEREMKEKESSKEVA